MNRLFAFLMIALLLGVVSLPVSAYELEVDGVTHNFYEVLSKTIFEVKDGKRQITNPFNGKVVKIFLRPGQVGQTPVAFPRQEVIPLGVFTHNVYAADSGVMTPRVFSSIEAILLERQKNPFGGTVEFRLYGSSYHRGRFREREISGMFRTVRMAMGQEAKGGLLSCVEMTGLLSFNYDLASHKIGTESPVHLRSTFIFNPLRARRASCP